MLTILNLNKIVLEKNRIWEAFGQLFLDDTECHMYLKVHPGMKVWWRGWLWM